MYNATWLSFRHNNFSVCTLVHGFFANTIIFCSSAQPLWGLSLNYYTNIFCVCVGGRVGRGYWDFLKTQGRISKKKKRKWKPWKTLWTLTRSTGSHNYTVFDMWIFVGDASRCQMKFDDPRVCKSFLLGCCPHDILSSTVGTVWVHYSFQIHLMWPKAPSGWVRTLEYVC